MAHATPSSGRRLTRSRACASAISGTPSEIRRFTYACLSGTLSPTAALAYASTAADGSGAFSIAETASRTCAPSAGSSTAICDSGTACDGGGSAANAADEPVIIPAARIADVANLRKDFMVHLRNANQCVALSPDNHIIGAPPRISPQCHARATAFHPDRKSVV